MNKICVSEIDEKNIFNGNSLRNISILLHLIRKRTINQLKWSCWLSYECGMAEKITVFISAWW
jgi:hypothetical protein